MYDHLLGTNDNVDNQSNNQQNEDNKEITEMSIIEINDNERIKGRFISKASFSS